jgi:hypothetical protein
MEIHERDCHLRLIAAFVDSAAAWQLNAAAVASVPEAHSVFLIN